MNCRLILMVGFAVFVSLAAGSGCGLAQEKEIDARQLPPAVSAAFHAAYPHAVIKGAAVEIENDVTCYEIESVDGQTRRDLLYAADGKVLETEESLDPAALPGAVSRKVAETYPAGKIQKAEKTTDPSGKIDYELLVQSGEKRFEIVLDPAGNILKTKAVASKAKKEESEKEEKEED
jgi:hypothetical protein